MVRAVVEVDLDVDDGIACQHAARERLGRALLDGRDVLARHAAAEDCLSECIAGAGLLRANLQPDIAVLAMAAALLLVLALHLDALADCLAVCDARLMQLELDAELALELVAQDLEVNLADAAQDCLMRLRILLHDDGRVFILLLGKRAENLVLLALLVGGSCHREHRGRVGDLLVDDGVGAVTERIARPNRLQLRRRDDVAGLRSIQMLLALALQGEDRTDALHILLVGMHVSGIALHRAREDAQIAHAADERIDNRLEDLCRERILRMALLEIPVLRIHADGDVEVRRRQILDDAVHELLDADVLLRRSAEYREDLASLDALDQSGRHLDLRDFRALDVLLEQFIVELRDGLDELLARLLDVALDVFRDVGDEVFLVMRDNLHVQGQEVDDALEGRFLANRQLHGHDARAEAHAQLLDDLVKVGVLAVHLVDEERARQLCLFGIAPCLLRLDLDARRGRDHDEGAVCRRQCALDFADEVRIARRIDEIDLIVTPFAGGKLQVDRHAAALFLRLAVERARVLFHTAEALDSTRIEEAGIEQACLARLAMADDGNVAQVGTLVRFHRNPS